MAKGERASAIEIPYIMLPNPGSDDSWFHIVYCQSDDAYFIFRTVVERGLGDYERVSCPTCGGEVRKRGGADDSHLSSTTVPEAVACLILSSRATPRLACLDSVTEDEINALSQHLARLPSLKSFRQLERVSALQNFRLALKSLRKKSSSNSSYIDLSKSRKQDEKLHAAATPVIEPNAVKPSEVVAASRHLSASYLARLKDEWLNSQRNIERSEKGKLPAQSRKSQSASRSKAKWFTTALTRPNGTLRSASMSVFSKKPIPSEAVWVTSLRFLAQEKRYLRALLTAKKSEL